MPLSFKDVRFTTRRVPGGEGDDLPVIYPRLLRDRSMLPKIEIAIRYFESMVGHERRELDSEVLVQFFGDHKLARCIVACLGRSYRFRPPRIGEIVTPAALRRLERAGLASPQALRIRLFDHVNAGGDGFLRGLERDPTFQRLEAKIGVRRGELDRLLVLDSEEHHVLTRAGAEPRAEDVVAQYNVEVLLAALRHAERIDLTLRQWSAEAAAVFQDVCAEHEVEATLTPSPSPTTGALTPSPSPRGGRREGGRTPPLPSWERGSGGEGCRLTLRGRQDALGVWSRHGRKVARAVAVLLERDRAAVAEGVAVLALKDRRAALRLTSEVLDILACHPAPAAGWDELPGWSAADMAAAVLTWRRIPGWSVRRQPEPQAWAAGALVPDLLLQGDGARFLVCAVRSDSHAARLAASAGGAESGDPLLFAGPAGVLGPLYAAGALVVAQDAFDLDEIVRRAAELAATRRAAPAATRRRLRPIA